MSEPTVEAALRDEVAAAHRMATLWPAGTPDAEYHRGRAGGIARALAALRSRGSTDDLSADFVRALDLHKERIQRLQDALCECPHRYFFQASLHDETCPVYVAVEVR